MSRRATLTLLTLIMESQSSKELEMPKEDPAEQHAEHAGGKTLATWEQNTYNAALRHPLPGATVPLTAAGDARCEHGAKLVAAVRAAVERASDG
jgi:hypothetical protein